jgi:hypothetical protein
MPDAEDTDRLATRRANYLEANTELSGSDATALAYSELGFSSSGIAKRTGSTRSTVKQRLRRAMARFGPAAAEVRLQFEIEHDLDPVTVDDIDGWPGADTYWQDIEKDPDPGPGAVWREQAERFPGVVPPQVRAAAGITLDETDDQHRGNGQLGLDGGRQ